MVNSRNGRYFFSAFKRFIPGLFPKEMIRRVGVMIFVATLALLYFLQPFDIVHGQNLWGVLRIATYALVVALTFYLMESYVRPYFQLKKTWYVVLWYATELLFIVNAVFICKALWMGWHSVSIVGYMVVMNRVLVITLLFMLLALLFHLLFRKPKELPVTLQSNDKNVTVLKVHARAILALTNDKNYTTVYYLSEGSCKAKLLRGSLNYFEGQVSFPIVRLHRSHMINLMHLESVEGNSQGKQVKLKQLPGTFSVSRKNTHNLDRFLNRL